MLYENDKQFIELEIMSNKTGEIREVVVDTAGFLAVINDPNTIITYAMYTNNNNRAGEYIISPLCKADLQTTEYLNSFHTIGNLFDNQLYTAAVYLAENTGNLTLHQIVSKYVKCIEYDYEEEGHFSEPTSEELVSAVNAETRMKQLTEQYIPEKVLYKSVDSFGWSPRTQNVLQRSGIYNIDQLVKYSLDDLYHLRNLGRRSIKEIVDTLVSYNVCLKYNGELSMELDGIEYAEKAILINPNVDWVIQNVDTRLGYKFYKNFNIENSLNNLGYFINTAKNTFENINNENAEFNFNPIDDCELDLEKDED